MAKVEKISPQLEPEQLRSKQESLLVQLDKRIEALKNLYILFFSGEIKHPPEKEREELQKSIRSMSQTEDRSPRINMMTQNLISKFTLYNNLWLKKMNELEFGVVPTAKKAKSPVPSREKAEKTQKQSIQVNLNDENSFEDFFQVYCHISEQSIEQDEEKEKIINMIKSKMIFNNLIVSNIEMSMSKGKLNLKIKK